MQLRRAVITGIGAITPLGCGKDRFWSELTSGQSGIRSITRFDADRFPVKVAGEVPDFEPREFLGSKDLRRFPLFTQFAVAAARQALEDADLKVTTGNRIGVCFGSCVAGDGEIMTEDVPAFLEKGCGALGPFLITTLTPHVATSAVCQVLGLQGARSSISAGCTSGLDVVEWARNQIESGASDALVIGASDAPLFPALFGIACQSRGYSTSSVSPRPFDHKHNGGALSEGAGALIIEEEEHARRRKAPIYARLIGYGSAGEPGDIFRGPDGTADVKALRRAIRSAGITPADVDCITPLAPGAPSVDKADARAIREVLGDHAYSVPVPALESSFGHLLAASGVLQVIAMALALKHQLVPPTINFDKAAEGCDLDCVPYRARYSRLRQVVAFSRSLNRTAVAVVLGQADSVASARPLLVGQ